MDENLERVRNRAIADCFEPGSIFKTFIAAPALDEGLTRLNETFEINGPTHRFGSRVVSDTHVHGSLTLAEVIAKSSNIGMGLLGQRCGNQRLFDYVRRFGFGERTGIELPGEHTGLVQDFSRWTSYSTSSIPIGYEVAVTPIQVAAAFAAVCNGGTLYQARIVRGVIAANGDVLEDRSTPIVVRQALDERSAREFRFGALAEVVRNGTGQKAAIPDYQVFGKSGTARVARADGRGYVPGAYAGSFVAAAPLEEPRAVVFVTLYRPKGSAYYGGTVSAPTAGAILADTLTYLGAPPDAPRDARRRAF
jgi:cell division protein FtsI (penicillin-binding protein 3)